MDAKLSKKILKIAREQQEQIEKADLDEEERDNTKKSFPLGFEIDEEEIEEIDQDADYEELEIDAADADILDKFLPSAPREKKTLADLIMEKINEKNAAEGREAIGKYNLN